MSLYDEKQRGGLNLVSAFPSLITEFNERSRLTHNLANTCHFEHEDKWVHELRDLSAIEEQGWSFASQFSVISIFTTTLIFIFFFF